MRTIYAPFVAGMAVIAANPAFAQDTGPDSPTSPAQAFSGSHVEATIGWDHLHNKSYNDTGVTPMEGSADGVTYGGAVGYDFALTNAITLGAELGIYGSSAKWDNTGNLVAGSFDTATVKPGRDIFVGARVGYALSPKTDLFAKAGYTNARFKVTGTDGTNYLYQSMNEDGFRLGAGVEQKLTRATYVKFEYDFSHYGSGQFDYFGATPNGSGFDLHNDRHQLLASVGLRF